MEVLFNGEMEGITVLKVHGYFKVLASPKQACNWRLAFENFSDVLNSQERLRFFSDVLESAKPATQNYREDLVDVSLMTRVFRAPATIPCLACALSTYCCICSTADSKLPQRSRLSSRLEQIWISRHRRRWLELWNEVELDLS